MKSHTRHYQGVGIVEVILMVAIVSVALMGLHQLMSYNFAVTSQGIFSTKAVLFAQEGVEAVRIMRNESWDTNIDPLVSGTVYYPILTGTTWSLTTTSPGSIDTIFDRQIVFEDVFRDVNNDIASSGTLDPNTKKVVITVSWAVSDNTRNITIPTYVTDLLDN
jgi:Tfp pilus assembly protein PilV